MDQATAQAHLDAWLAADLAVAAGQSYTIGSRSLTRADAESIRQQVDYWRQQLEIIKNKDSRVSNPRVVYSTWNA